MKEKPIKKAWKGIIDNWADLELSPREDHSKYDIVYAETRSKARYQFALRWDWYQNSEWIRIKVRRSPENDLYEARPDEVLLKITEGQKQIIAHANGNRDDSPGHRDNYYCSAKDKDLLKLVDIGLMVGPQHTDSKMIIPGNGFFYLTDTGKKAALSMLPRKKGMACV